MGKDKKLQNAVNVQLLPKGGPIQFFEADTFKQMCGKDMKYAKYPTLLDFSGPRFQLRSLKGIDSVSGGALAELNVNANKLTSLSELDIFSNVRSITARNNNISDCELKLPKLQTLNLGHNQVSEIVDISKCPQIKQLDLSFNVITGERVFLPLAKSKKLESVNLQGNGINMTAYQFVQALDDLKSLGKLSSLDLRKNKVAELPYYRNYVIQKCRRLKTLDGEPVVKEERKVKPPAPTQEEEAEEESPEEADAAGAGAGTTVTTEPKADKEEAKDEDKKGKAKGKKGKKEKGKKGKEKDEEVITNFVFQDLKGLLIKCFDKPDEAVSVMASLEDYVKEIVDLKPQLRYISYDPMLPDDSIEEFIQSLELLMQRLPQLAAVSLRILARLIAMLEDPIGGFCFNEVKKLLDAKAFNEPIWLALRDVVVPQLVDTHEDLTRDLREHFIEVLYLVSTCEWSDVRQFLRPLVPAFAKSIQEEQPTDFLLGLIAAAASDAETAVELREQGTCDRVVELVERARKKPKSPTYAHLVRIINQTARSDKVALHLYVQHKLHAKLLVLINQMSFDKTARWPEEDALWAADIVACADGLCEHDTALMAALQSDYLKRVMEIVDFPDVVAKLLATAMRAVHHLLELTHDQHLHDEIAQGLGYMVPLLDYIEGKGYENMCVQCDAMEKGDPVPLGSLVNPKIFEVLQSIVQVLMFFGVHANLKDPVAMQVSSALDSAGRERYLFALLQVPDDDIRLATVHCLANVPLENLQEDEVDDIVHLIQAAKAIGAGRTEEVLAVVLQILETLATSPTPQGIDFRERHAESIKIVLRLLEQNAMRDTSDSETETEEKALLSDACVNFLLAASSGWDEAIEVMRSPEAVKITSQILKYEEIYGSPDRAIWVEKSALGSTIDALVTYLKALQLGGHIATRVITRMAEVIEGPQGAPPSEDEENQDAKIWVKRHVLEESEKEREHRHKQCGDFLKQDCVTLLLEFLRTVKQRMLIENEEGEEGAMDEETKKKKEEDLDSLAYRPRDLVSSVLAEAQELEDEEEERQEQMGALGEEEDEEDVGAELEHDIKRKEVESAQRQKNKMLQDDEEAGLDDEAEDFVPPKPLGSLEPASDTLQLAYTPHAPVLAATLRTFLAMLWYGDNASREDFRIRLREMHSLRFLAVLARDAEWYSYNVGPKLLLLISDLFAMSPVEIYEPISSLPLYDVVSQVLEDMLKSTDKRLDQCLSLTPRQELGVLYLTKLWYQIMWLVSYMHFSKPNARNINYECSKTLFASLISMTSLTQIIRFLYYDKQVSTSPKFSNKVDNPHLLQLRDVARINATLCIAEYVQVQADNRYEIFEHFNRLEVKEHISLHPSYLQHLLINVENLTYHRALERYMADQFIMSKPERILECAWLKVGTFGQSSPELRLLVLSNIQYYLLKEPFGMKCSACPPDKFCPQGPGLKQKLQYAHVDSITIGYGGNRMLVRYTEPGLIKRKESLYLCADQLGVIDRMVDGFRAKCPDASVHDDKLTLSIVQKALTQPDGEIVLLSSPVDKINIRAVPQSRLMVLSNTHIYNFKENFAGWRGDDTKEADATRMLELKTKHLLRDVTKVELGGGTELSLKLIFKNDPSSFYHILFGDFMARELWRRTLADATKEKKHKKKKRDKKKTKK